jgi:hypothetical protein
MINRLENHLKVFKELGVAEGRTHNQSHIEV